jgi:hypothetical protein
MEQKNNRSIWGYLTDFLTGKVIQQLDIQKTTQMLSLVGLFAFFIIANTYHGQKQVHKIEQMKRDLKELKFQYTVTKAGLMEINKQSSLEETLEARGLNALKRPPQKIVIRKE